MTKRKTKASAKDNSEKAAKEPQVLRKLTGTEFVAASERLLKGLLNALPAFESLPEQVRDKRIEAAPDMLEKLAPQDGAEGILAAQMVACHEVLMDTLRRAQHPEITLPAWQEFMKNAHRMMTLFTKATPGAGQAPQQGPAESDRRACQCRRRRSGDRRQRFDRFRQT